MQIFILFFHLQMWYDDTLDRVLMEVLKDVTRDDLNDEAHDIHIYCKPVSSFSMFKSAIIYLRLRLSINLK